MGKKYKKKHQTKSPGDLKEYLTFMAKFDHYSPSNISLIQIQFEGARAVGSFSVWKEKGFAVKKGHGNPLQRRVSKRKNKLNQKA